METSNVLLALEEQSKWSERRKRLEEQLKTLQRRKRHLIRELELVKKRIASLRDLVSSLKEERIPMETKTISIQSLR